VDAKTVAEKFRWVYPVVIGSGQRLVREGAGTCGLRVADRLAFDGDIVVMSYQPASTEDWCPSGGQTITDLALAMLGVSSGREDR
jgi:hypothetical protein